jgi:cytochrome P450
VGHEWLPLGTTEAIDHRKIGSLLGLWLVLGSVHNPIRFSEHIYRRFGRIVEFDLLALPNHAPVKNLFLIEPDHNREVLLKTDAVRPSGLWSVNGPPGSAQHAIRKHNFLKTHSAEHDFVAQGTNPHLKRTRVEGHFEQTKAIIQDEIAKWPHDHAVDLYDVVRRLGQHVSFTLLFGEKDIDRIQTFGDLIFGYHRGNWNWLAYLLPVNVKGTPYHRVLQTAEMLKSYIRDWIAESHARSPDDNLVAAFAHLKDGEGNPPTAERILAYMVFYGFASYEALSSGTTWALLLLMLHPDIMADLLDELSAAPALDDIDHATLSSLKLLDAVVKEVLRLIPPTPVVPFRVFASCNIAGRDLYPSNRIVLFPHMTHRLPDIYDAPMRFRPERWFNINPSPYEYLPFSAGPRRCPGSWFGTDFIKVALVAILTRYRLELDRRARLDWRFAGITMPKSGALVHFVDQDRVVQAQPATGSIFDFFERSAMA